MPAKSLQLCLTLCDPMDCSLPGSTVCRILQARILEWVSMPSFRGSSRPRDRTHVSYVSCIGRQVIYHQHHLGSPTTIQPTLTMCFIEKPLFSPRRLRARDIKKLTMWSQVHNGARSTSWVPFAARIHTPGLHTDSLLMGSSWEPAGTVVFLGFFFLSNFTFTLWLILHCINIYS